MTYEIDISKITTHNGGCHACEWIFNPNIPEIIPYVHSQKTGHPTWGRVLLIEDYEQSETNIPDDAITN